MSPWNASQAAAAGVDLFELFYGEKEDTSATAADGRRWRPAADGGGDLCWTFHVVEILEMLVKVMKWHTNRE